MLSGHPNSDTNLMFMLVWTKKMARYTMCEIILEWLSKSLIIIVRSIESVLATLQTLANKVAKR